MMSAQRMDVIPLANVQQVDRGGRGVASWKSQNDDPQFLLVGRRTALEAGWYLFEADFEDIEGPFLSPCLYPDYGSGLSELERVVLPEPDRDGRIRTVFPLMHRAAMVRFDPSAKMVAFGLADVKMRRLGRAGALWHMAKGAAQARRDWRGGREVVATFLRAVLRGGFRHGGGAARASYLSATQPSAGDYLAWTRSHDAFTARDIDDMRREAEALPHKPLVSILVPVYDTGERWLRKCIDSVLAQAYPHWELCIADDASPARHVRKVLEGYARRDPRIRACFRERNGHISEASNSALAMARGEYVALLDHDDELRPHALLEMVKAAGRVPDAALFYSDEDKIDVDGRRFDPYFKPDWDPDLVLGQNYVCHFTMARTDLVRALGGFRTGFEGSQDHDLVLRCAERLDPSRIVHVPKILYHWRAIAGSSAFARDAKDYASAAGAKAIGGHLERMHPRAAVEELPHGHYRVRWPLPRRRPTVSLVVPTRDKAALLRACVESILSKTTYPDFEIVVVDNRSSDPEALAYLAAIGRLGRVRVLRYDAPFNYSAINNWAVQRCDGEVIGLVNNDIEVITPDWLEEMVSQAVRPGVGAVGAMLYYPNDTIQHAGVVLGVHGVAAHAYAGRARQYPGQCGRARVAQSVSAVTAACLVVRREVFAEAGGLDESLAIAFNDLDFCLRIREAGYRNVWTPFAEMYHHESASRGYEDSPERLARFHREVAAMTGRWGDLLRQDPYYNPNLTLAGAPFDLAFPPREPARH